jgi:hypothetical protein
MTHDSDHPTTTEGAEDAEDIEEVVSVVCGRTWFDTRLDRYAFAFHCPRQQRPLHPAPHQPGPLPARPHLPAGPHTHPRCDHRPTQQPDPPAEAA